LVPFVAFCSEHFRVSHRRRSRCGAQEAVFQLFRRAENRYVAEQFSFSVSEFQLFSFFWDRYADAMDSNDLIAVDPDILGGTPVFKGTRVPVATLFEYLENDYKLEEFLECFPSVTREMACSVLERSETVLLAPA
jgi:uncharacterized protein (DUF433 family)